MARYAPPMMIAGVLVLVSAVALWPRDEGRRGDGEGVEATVADAPPPPSVPVTVILDNRCVHEECRWDRVIQRVRATFPGADITELDYSTAEGRELYERAQLKRLPALLLGSEHRHNPEILKKLHGFTVQSGLFVKTLGRFDPTRGEWLDRPVVPIRLLTDARCDTQECRAARQFDSFIRLKVPNADIVELDYGDVAGKALWQRVNTELGEEPAAGDRPARPVALPLALFGTALEQETDAYSRLRPNLRKMGDEFVYQFGDWDPTAEICDNERDDDGDGRVDCRDDQCSGQALCRPGAGRGE